MTRTPGGYTRLPGHRLLSFGVVHRLFAGPDHVLLLASTSFSETYKRFYYRDIQAVVMRKTRRGAVWNAVLGIPAGLFLFLAATREPVAAWWLCALPFLLLLLVNWLRGPTCAAHLRTAVQLAELPTLGRLRGARKAVALLKPRIAAAQGVLAPEAVPLAVREGPPDPGRAVPPAVPAPVPAARDAGRAHEFLFYALVVDGIVSILSFQVRSPWVGLLGIAPFIGVTALLIAAMIRQRQRPVPPGLRTALWATVGYWSLNVVVSYAYALSAVMKNPKIGQSQWELMKHLASIRPADSPLGLFAHLFGIVCPLAIGGAGLVALLRHRDRERQRGPRPAPAAP